MLTEQVEELEDVAHPVQARLDVVLGGAAERVQGARVALEAALAVLDALYVLIRQRCPGADDHLLAAADVLAEHRF